MKVEVNRPVIVQPPAKVVLTLTEDEARDLKALLGCVGGTVRTGLSISADANAGLQAHHKRHDNTIGIRTTTDALWSALKKAGIK